MRSVSGVGWTANRGGNGLLYTQPLLHTKAMANRKKR